MIEKVEGFQRVVNPTIKHRGNPIVLPEEPWEAGTLILDNAVVFDEAAGSFKMYCMVPGFATLKDGRRTSFFTSQDGLRWERPQLGLVEFSGSSKTNLLPAHVSQVIYDPREGEPESHRFKGVGYRGPDAAPTAGKPRSEQYAAFSADGVHWTIADDFQLDNVGDVFTPSRTKEIQKLTSQGEVAGSHGIRFRTQASKPSPANDPPYMGFVRITQPFGKVNRRVLTLTTSQDFIHWTSPLVILKPDQRDDELAESRLASGKDAIAFDHPDDHRCEFYYMTGFRYEGIYLGLMFVFDVSYERSRMGRSNQDGPRYVELVFSRDLKQWHRFPDRSPFIPLGPAGSWDGGMIGYAAAPIIVDDEIRIYYGGQRLTHGALWEEEIKKIHAGQAVSPTSCVGLATLRRDGWVSFDAGAEPGTLVTKPFALPRGTLWLNADAAQGEITAELLDERNKSLAKSVPIKGDKLRSEIEFTSPMPPHGTPVRLRLKAKHAKLYSYWFEEKL